MSGLRRWGWRGVAARDELRHGLEEERPWGMERALRFRHVGD